ncbi:cytochrome P450 [Arenibacterium halophilum]|uniref:Cytochrome P450 n=1 Tax=Arenibacterium halophilum TaxID=2583821 RepID=A0ABY2X5F6_9RHOB|nr:cytochrome P450 [Arenibacterium halophilum]TMV10680.1 cytochrome P450 [Arenibacterium halophilum]
MATTLAKTAPVDHEITIAQLTEDPYRIFRRLRAEAPVLHVASIKRTLLTKAADTKYVKENPALFSSDDPTTPMERAFRAHTLMRKDAEEHLAERNAMAPTFAGRNIKACWEPIYTRIAEDFVARLPRGETVDLFKVLAAPFAAHCLKHLLGIEEASDAEMERWSQTLIDGAGNFGYRQELFDLCDVANDEMDALFARAIPRHRADPNASALSVMVNADAPIAMSQIYANIKIAIGGGINEPRDALLTILYGLLTNPDQMEAAKRDALWADAFEEGVRWVAPIQASSRKVMEDTEIRGIFIPKGDIVMTSQASACHDEELYDEPERYNIFRPRTPHQAFGNGPHFCQGTHIARRMLANILLPMLFDRFPDMALPEPDKVKFWGFGFRGPLSLPVTLN